MKRRMGLGSYLDLWVLFRFLFPLLYGTTVVRFFDRGEIALGGSSVCQVLQMLIHFLFWLACLALSVT